MQKAAAVAALFNALIAVANLAIMATVLGPAIANAPRDAINATAALARTGPAPLAALEVLKLLLAASTLVLVMFIRLRLSVCNAPNVRLAMFAGFAGSAFLSVGALVGLFALAQAGRTTGAGGGSFEEISAIVTYIGLFALLSYGIWYLLTASAAIKFGGLSLRLAYFTFLAGAANVLAFFLPPLAILSMIIGLGWSVWFGVFLWCEVHSTV